MITQDHLDFLPCYLLRALQFVFYVYVYDLFYFLKGIRSVTRFIFFPLGVHVFYQDLLKNDLFFIVFPLLLCQR